MNIISSAMYKSKDDGTPDIFSELSPFGGKLNPRNRWIRLAELVPWADIEEKYRAHYSPVGRPAKDARLVCGLLAVKFLESCSYDRAVQEFCENPYIQYFCGLDAFATGDDMVSPGLLPRKRKEMAETLFDKFEADLLNIINSDHSLRDCFRQAPHKPGSAGGLLDKVRAAFKKLLG